MNYFAYFLILAGALLRFVPHEPNFAPIAALALFGGTYLHKKYALLIPLGAMVISDIFLGFDSFVSRASVYGSFVLIGAMGLWLRKNKTIGKVIGVTVTGSLLFYIITNLVWLYPPTMYPHTLAGQAASYINALPFFRGTLLGDLFYVGAFFGIYEGVKVLQKRRIRFRESEFQT